MTFNRLAFEQIASERSPLTPGQLDTLFGTIDETNKAEVWRFLQLDAKAQFAVRQLSEQVRKHFPEARVTRVK